MSTPPRELKEQEVGFTFLELVNTLILINKVFESNDKKVISFMQGMGSVNTHGFLDAHDIVERLIRDTFGEDSLNEALRIVSKAVQEIKGKWKEKDGE